MKIDISKGVGVQTNVTDSEKTEMSISASMGIALVTKYLYKNPIQTLTQEYLCNARDAHRDAGTDRKIEVTLPTMIDQSLRIRDFGKGISSDLMKNVFCVLGESTKRDSDNPTGGFGIGGKSALAYTDSFMVRSFNGGYASLYLIHVGTDQRGTIELLEKQETSDSTGVEIIIPIKTQDISSFHKAVYRATFFWNDKPVIKGIFKEEVPSYWEGTKPIIEGDNWAIYSNESLVPLNILNAEAETNLVFSIDSIPYKVTGDFKFDAISKLKKTSKEAPSLLSDYVTLVIKVGNGDLNVAANREDLKNSNFSLKNADEILESVIVKMEEHRSSVINACKNVSDMVKAMIYLKSLFGKVKEITLSRDKYEVSYNPSYELSFNQKEISHNGLSSYIYVHYDKKDKTNRIVGNQKNVIKCYAYERVVLITNDPKVGERKRLQKIKHLVLKDKDVNHYLLATTSKDIIDALKSELNVISVSDIQEPVKERVKRVKVDRSNQCGMNRLYVSGNSLHSVPEYLDLSPELFYQKWFYIVRNKNVRHFPLLKEKCEKASMSASIDYSNDKLKNVVEYFKDQGFNFCEVSEIQQKTLPTNFKSLDSFLANEYTLTEQEEKNLRWNAIRSVPTWVGEIFSVEAHKNRLNSRVFNTFEKYYKIRNEYRMSLTPVPNFIKEYSCFEKVQSIKKDVKLINDEMISVIVDFPLLSKYTDSLSCVDDLIIYLNSKQEALDKKSGL